MGKSSDNIIDLQPKLARSRARGTGPFYVPASVAAEDPDASFWDLGSPDDHWPVAVLDSGGRVLSYSDGPNSPKAFELQYTESDGAPISRERFKEILGLD